MIIIIIFPTEAWGYRRNEQALLDRKISEFVSSRWHDEFASLCRLVDTPCGIEYSAEFLTLYPLPHKGMHLHHVSVRKVLDAIVTRYPKYRWYVDKGVINLVPGEVLTARNAYASLLDQPIGTIAIDNESLFDAAFHICRKGRIQCADLQHHLDGMSPQYRKITMQLSHISIRDALNALARRDGHSMWAFSPKEGRYTNVVQMEQW
jgi:hypothetical protein